MLVALAFATLCALVVAVGWSSSAGAQRAKVLGKTKDSPHSACPRDTNRDPCAAVGTVTGFQVEADGKRRLFRAPENAKLVGWAIDLSKPTREQREFFADVYGTDRFGTKPTARLSVLKPLDGPDFKLKAQSPVIDLTAGLGSKQYYTLNQPLPIHKDWIAALTLPTWASSFALKVNKRANLWKASRDRGRCGDRQATSAKPHLKVGSVREYGCSFPTRLLYWAYYVPDSN